ncbi:MAG: multiple sugar transport system substrate-binding protein [Paraglaciecola sp.]|jgi:multiple sugar transport system substrate-binding protein
MNMRLYYEPTPSLPPKLLHHPTLRCVYRAWMFITALIITLPASSLTIGVLHDNVTERYNFIEIKRSFNQQFPGIDIEFIGMPSGAYKPKVSEWLRTETGPDAFLWYGGERLMQFVRKGYVENLNELAAKLDWHKNFPEPTLQIVSFQESIYAVPISFYQWGIFYNKQVLARYNIQAPVNWEDFLAACQTLKKNKLDPIAIGSGDPWVVAAWFDYLNLRINGLDFHQSLLRGEIAFTDKRVVKVFEYWAELIKAQYFLAGHDQLKWNEAMPYLFRDLAGFTLIGNFLAVRIPQQLEKKIGFMPFPVIVPEHAGFEEGPIDVFFIRASSKNKQDAKKFLAYLSRADAQTDYNRYAGGFPPNKAGTTSDNYFNQAGLNLLQNATGLSQFFDRDTNDHFSDPAMKIFVQFMQQADIPTTVQKLEILRQTELIPDKP